MSLSSAKKFIVIQHRPSSSSTTTTLHILTFCSFKLSHSLSLSSNLYFSHTENFPLQPLSLLCYFLRQFSILWYKCFLIQVDVELEHFQADYLRYVLSFKPGKRGFQRGETTVRFFNKMLTLYSVIFYHVCCIISTTKVYLNLRRFSIFG